MSGKSRVTGNKTTDASYSRESASRGNSHPQSNDSKSAESSRNTQQNSALGSVPSPGSFQSHDIGRHSSASSTQCSSPSKSSASGTGSAGKSNRRHRSKRTGEDGRHSTASKQHPSPSKSSPSGKDSVVNLNQCHRSSRTGANSGHSTASSDSSRSLGSGKRGRAPKNKPRNTSHQSSGCSTDSGREHSANSTSSAETQIQPKSEGGYNSSSSSQRQQKVRRVSIVTNYQISWQQIDFLVGG